jgi:hypothetical protein
MGTPDGGAGDADPGELATIPLCRMPSIGQLQVVRLPGVAEWLMVDGTAAPR